MDTDSSIALTCQGNLFDSSDFGLAMEGRVLRWRVLEEEYMNSHMM